MVVDNLTHNGQAQACAIRFAKTDEGVEKRVLDTFGYAWPIIADPNLEGAAFFIDSNSDRPVYVRSRLTGIQDQVEEDALELTGVEHSLEIVRGHQGNLGIAEFRFRMDCFNGSAN